MVVLLALLGHYQVLSWRSGMWVVLVTTLWTVALGNQVLTVACTYLREGYAVYTTTTTTTTRTGVSIDIGP
ncbi:hypothetical protein GGS21DRAFT_503587 [Xylaria nigripes]|nr:hypothetical protein GGS21DRAFT_503587 [Xylaria nigripes]